MNEIIKDRIKGSLYAFAIGDAMGATTEFMTKDQIKELFPEGLKDIVGGGWLGLPRGEVTDDTEMMMAVAQAYMDAYSMNEEVYLLKCCENFTSWMNSHPRDVGNTCRTAIIENGGKPPFTWIASSWDRQVRGNRRDLGNGSLMRALVPSLMGDYNGAIDQGKLTHNNNTQDSVIREYAKIVDSLVRGSLRPLESSLWGNTLNDPSGFVLKTYNNALYWAYHSNTLEEAIVGAVNDGGDADTIAAITGSLAGARWGFSCIPERWVEALSPQVREQLDEVIDWICKHLI